jgi:hypothetical protein
MIIYFAVHLIFLMTDSNAFSTDAAGVGHWHGPFHQTAVRGATTTVAVAPMIGVLFLATRIRKFEVTGWADDTKVQRLDWAQWAYALCSLSIASLTVLNLFSSKQQGDIQSQQKPGALRSTRVYKLRVFSAACFCLGLIMFVVDIVSLDEAGGGSSPVPCGLRCVFALAALHFSVYLAMWIASSIETERPVHQKGDFTTVLNNFLGGRAKEAVSFCPVFCILFLGAFARARQLSSANAAASPEPWCMTVDLVATCAIIVLTFVRVGAVLPSKWYVLSGVCTMLQYLCLTVLYFTVIAVVVALFVMTPPNAASDAHAMNGRYSTGGPLMAL